MDGYPIGENGPVCPIAVVTSESMKRAVLVAEVLGASEEKDAIVLSPAVTPGVMPRPAMGEAAAGMESPADVVSPADVIAGTREVDVGEVVEVVDEFDRRRPSRRTREEARRRRQRKSATVANPRRGSAALIQIGRAHV